VARYRGTLKPGECVSFRGGRLCNRWQKNTAAATEEYTRGVKTPRRSWGKTCCESQPRWKAGVDKAHTKDALRKGVMRARTRKWQTKTLLKGPARFAEGVYDAGDAYAEGYKPYHARYPSIFLPKRYPRGDPRNIERVKVVCTEFGRVRVGKVETGKIICPED
jgi:hypothetical protein